jgi:hypothetical protein
LNLKVYHHSCRNNGNKPGEEIIKVRLRLLIESAKRVHDRTREAVSDGSKQLERLQKLTLTNLQN